MFLQNNPPSPIKCTLKGSNSEPSSDFSLVLFIKDCRSGFNLNREKEEFFFNFASFPNSQFSILAHTKDGAKLAVLEAMPKEGESNYEIIVKAEDENTAIKSKLENYLLPRKTIAFLQKTELCCPFFPK